MRRPKSCGRNLYGVDLNPESVEITRLALWLKTARREHRLARIWRRRLRSATASSRTQASTPAPLRMAGGVPGGVRARRLRRGDRQSALRADGAHQGDQALSRPNYIVASDRADLYAYFFERGLRGPEARRPTRLHRLVDILPHRLGRAVAAAC